MLGELILTGTNVNTIDLSDVKYTKGMYIFRFDNNVIRKIVKF